MLRATRKSAKTNSRSGVALQDRKWLEGMSNFVFLLVFLHSFSNSFSWSRFATSQHTPAGSLWTCHDLYRFLSYAPTCAWLDDAVGALRLVSGTASLTGSSRTPFWLLGGGHTTLSGSGADGSKSLTLTFLLAELAACRPLRLRRDPARLGHSAFRPRRLLDVMDGHGGASFLAAARLRGGSQGPSGATCLFFLFFFRISLLFFSFSFVL